MAFLELCQIGFSYPGKRPAVLSGINLTFKQEGIAAIIGPNGCGKTTLTKVMTGILPPTSGEVLLAVRSVHLLGTRGLVLGASVVLRLLVVIAAAILLTTSNSRDFISGLLQWKVPYEIAFMVSVTIRFLPIFRDEFVNVVTAVQLRGVELKQIPWGRKIYLFRHLFFSLVYGAILKAQQLAIAMEARGFRAYPQRTYLRQLQLSFVDYVSMVFFPTATLMLIGIHVYLT